jgi:hypothetical protein
VAEGCLADLAQLVERAIRNRKVPSSTLGVGSISKKEKTSERISPREGLVLRLIFTAGGHSPKTCSTVRRVLDRPGFLA